MNLRLVFILMAAFTSTAFAHDPSMHGNVDGSTQSPDCEKMAHMDMSKMDPNDPVMKAMHQKCAGHQDEKSPSDPKSESRSGSRQDSKSAVDHDHSEMK